MCDSCKYNIIDEPFSSCIVCLKPTIFSTVCQLHRVPYERAYCVGWRQDFLEKLIGQSKFDSVRDSCRAQGSLLAEVLPQFNSNIVIVPIPTIRPHIRERGYDHMLLVAKELARQRDTPAISLLERVVNTSNTGASRVIRRQQAAKAFRVRGPLDPQKTYLLIDDVYTTGATLTEAAKLLKSAGAGAVWIAATTRQPPR